jgi:hypothetical protein
VPTNGVEALALDSESFLARWPAEERRRAMRYTLPARADGKPNLAFVLKACPRCVGDLVLQRDLNGEYYTCLQCGVQIEARPRAAETSGHRSGRHAAAASGS